MKIDPTLPEERKRYIARDSNASLVLVSKADKDAGIFESDLARPKLDRAKSSLASTTTTISVISSTYSSDNGFGQENFDPNTSTRRSVVSLEEFDYENLDELAADSADIEEAELDDVAYLLYTSGWFSFYAILIQ